LFDCPAADRGGAVSVLWGAGPVNRRSFLAFSASAIAASGQAAGWAAAAQDAGAPQPFDANNVRQVARALASKPYQKPKDALPSAYANLKYDAYRDIRFRPDQALWRGTDLPFQVQFFHRGFIYTDRVDIFVVSDGKAEPVRYAPDLFTFGPLAPKPTTDDLGFAGFRLHAKINRPDYFDEVAVFLGASYFRAVAMGQVYGLSARGLSIRTADPKGEEFPRFTAFWIEKPAPQATSIVVHALLDSESASAAFRFTIRPGETTVFDTEMSLYPRADIAESGIASSTSMFLFDANDRVGVDDFRTAVHDSDGLAIRNGRMEEIWRPLTDPKDLQVSVFSDLNPRGFGLMQRERDFFAYDDLESHFEKRPSLWVEPIGDWGQGGVYLIEIPTKEEIHDNIVSFWRPKEPLKAKGEYNYTYRLHWTYMRPNPRHLATFAKTRTGAGPNGTRRFVLELSGPALFSADPSQIKTTVSASKGAIKNLVVQKNAETGGMRVSFELDPKGETVVELRGVLLLGETPISETWLYRWTQ
jgi:glucans biosynthesis protein